MLQHPEHPCFLRHCKSIFTVLFSTGDTISYIPGDNPVYGITENRTNRTNSITSETAEFDNPIYGSQGSLNDAELINPIYGDADFEDVLYTAVSDYVTPVAPVYDYVQNSVQNKLSVVHS